MRFIIVGSVGLVAAACATTKTGIPVLDAYPPDVSGTTHISWYDVHGRTAAEVDADMRRQAPRDGIGPLAETWPPIRSTYRVQGNGISCSPEDARAFVDGRIVLPHWVETPDAEPGLSAQWNTFLQSLIRHEVGHKEIASRAAEELATRLSSLGASCMTFSRDVYQLTSSIVAREQNEQKQYDLDTYEAIAQASVARPERPSTPVAQRPPAPSSVAAPISAPPPVQETELGKVAAKAARVSAHPDTVSLGVGSVLSLDVFRLTVYDSSGVALTDLIGGNYDIRLTPCAVMSGSGREYRGTAAGTCALDLVFPGRYWTRPDSAPSAHVTVRFTR